jgi:hypothetical protein
MDARPCYNCGHPDPEIIIENGFYVHCPKCLASAYTCHDTDWAIRSWNDFCELRNPQLKKAESQLTTVYIVMDLVPAVFSTIEKARERVFSMRPILFAQLQSEHKFQLADSMIHTIQIQ